MNTFYINKMMYIHVWLLFHRYMILLLSVICNITLSRNRIFVRTFMKHLWNVNGTNFKHLWNIFGTSMERTLNIYQRLSNINRTYIVHLSYHYQRLSNVFEHLSNVFCTSIVPLSYHYQRLSNVNWWYLMWHTIFVTYKN